MARSWLVLGATFFALLSCDRYEYIPQNTPPTPVTLDPVVYREGSFILTWSKSTDNDFAAYWLIEALQEDMSDSLIINSSNIKQDTTYTVEDIIEGRERFYRVLVLDKDSLSTASNIVFAVSPLIAYQRVYGGAGNDLAYGVQQTTDDGFIIAGHTDSWGSGGIDALLIKTNIEGAVEWQLTYGGSADDWYNAIAKTTDGGFILAGTTHSTGQGASDAWLVKTNSDGHLQWQQTFGDSLGEWSRAVQQTTDLGYIMIGHTLSFGAGYYDILLVKTNAQGQEEWIRTFGGNAEDFGYGVTQTPDGGYALVGFTVSTGSGGRDIWLIKTDAQGEKEWTRTFGGVDDDVGTDIQTTPDGGFIITGYTASNSFGLYDFILLKTDTQGHELWSHNIGNGNYESASSVSLTADGGFIITGYTISYGNGLRDCWLVKTAADGLKEWSMTFGGIYNDEGSQVLQTVSGGYVIVGHTESLGGGQRDVQLIKTTPIP